MQIWIALAIVAVIVLRRFSAIAGSALGLTVAAAVGMWGFVVYSGGGKMVFLFGSVPPAGFYAAIAVWLAVEAYSLTKAVQRRRAAPRGR